jgi:hypothetical protein
MRRRWRKPHRDPHERFASKYFLLRVDGAHHDYGVAQASQGHYRCASRRHRHDDRAIDGDRLKLRSG